jgi:phage shock protein A
MAKPNLFVRVWRYLTAALTGKFEELADPKVQLEQAITEAQDQHRRLKEQAANVIANQKQTEMKLDRAMTELESLNANAQQALLMAEDARTSGDQTKADEYERTAESIATRLIAVEKEVEDLKGLLLDASRASEQAKAAVEQNAQMLQAKLAEKQRLLSQLDQAKMAEQMNTAMASLNEAVGQEVPSFEEVRDKIEKRQARAQGRAELEGGSVQARMREVEQASRNVEAQTRLSELRSKLGIQAPAAAETPTTEGAGTENATEPSAEQPTEG